MSVSTAIEEVIVGTKSYMVAQMTLWACAVVGLRAVAVFIYVRTTKNLTGLRGAYTTSDAFELAKGVRWNAVE